MVAVVVVIVIFDYHELRLQLLGLLLVEHFLRMGQAVHRCSCGQSAWSWPSVAKVRTSQDRGYLENAIGDLKARWSLKNTNTLERQA
jgi:hypothetical protein